METRVLDSSALRPLGATLSPRVTTVPNEKACGLNILVSSPTFKGLGCS